MKAVQLLTHGSPGRMALADVPLLDPAPGEVRVKVRACGLNHLDLWAEEGDLPVRIDLPRIQGCEIAGIVERTGERVAVQSNIFCGQCEYCLRGEESQCLANVMLGVQRDGGFAEYVNVPERALVRLPDSVDFVSSAALTLAGSTAMHMLTDRATVRPNDWVLVMAGASGVGSAAIQIARGLGARVISTGSTPEKRDLAQRLGAEFALDTTQPDWAAEVRRMTGKRGVDVVVEHVGGSALKQVFGCLARGGTIVTCGATAGRNVEIDLWPLFVKQQRLVGSYGRNRGDFVRTLDWIVTGKLKPSIDTALPLEKTAEAFQRLRERKVLGKVVIEVP